VRELAAYLLDHGGYDSVKKKGYGARKNLEEKK